MLRRRGRCHSFGAVLLTFAGAIALAVPAAADEPAPRIEKVRADAIGSIDKSITARWQAENLMPAGRCSDHAFLRRASLDIIGRIPTLDEIERYLRDPADRRRSLLVERLLASPEYPAHWARRWTDWLLPRDSPEQYRAVLRRWLETEVLAREEVSYKEMVERLLTARGTLRDNGAVTFTLAYLGNSASVGFPYFQEGCGAVSALPFGSPERDPDATPAERAARLTRVGQFDMQPLTTQTLQLFLGYRLTCCQCHDHPFNAEWRQKDFWGVNAFLRQVERRGTPGQATLEIRDNPEQHRQPMVFFEKRNGVIVGAGPRFLDGRRLPATAGSRREHLAGIITSHPNFAPTAVNRFWAHFFGWSMNERGLPDDFGDHNDLVHPELLEELSRQFAGPADYRPRELIRWICNSKPYHLKAEANATNEEDDKSVFLSRFVEKGLEPDVLRESLLVALCQRAEDAAAQQVRRVWEQEFPSDAWEDRPTLPSLRQALALMNSPRLHRALRAPGGTLARAQRQTSARAALDFLFLAALTRPMTAAEYRELSRHLSLEGGRSPSPEVLEDLLWALINCNEFYVSH